MQIANTDNQVTDKSMNRALKNGYGADWDGEAKELRQKVVDRLQRESGGK